jgi:hypothetical protein
MASYNPPDRIGLFAMIEMDVEGRDPRQQLIEIEGTYRSPAVFHDITNMEHAAKKEGLIR